jgi:hypothetical protein
MVYIIYIKIIYNYIIIIIATDWHGWTSGVDLSMQPRDKSFVKPCFEFNLHHRVDN